MKQKNGQAGMGIAMVAISILVGVAMIPVLASLIDEAQVIQTAIENLTNTEYNTTTTLAYNDLVVGSIVITNATCDDEDDGPTTSCNGTLRDGYEFELNEISGVLKIINRTGAWNCSYEFEPDTYVDSASGRTIVLLITLIYAVGLIVTLCVGVGLIRK